MQLTCTPSSVFLCQIIGSTPSSLGRPPSLRRRPMSTELIALAPAGSAHSSPLVQVTQAKTDNEFPAPPAQPFGVGTILLLVLLSPFLLVLFLLVGLVWLGLLPFRSCMHQSAALRTKPMTHDLIEMTGGGSGGAWFQSAHGSWLFYRRWMPELAPGASPKGVIYLAHGFGEHISRTGYVLLAQKLNAAGYALFALDHQGHGRSSGDRAFFARIEHVVEEYMEFSRQTVTGITPQTPRFWMGHSMGGLITLSAALRSTRPEYRSLRSSAFRGCILSSPCLAVDPKLATAPLKVAAMVLSEVLPKLVLEGIPPEALSRNKLAVEEYKADPLNWHGGARARVGAEMLAEMKATLAQLDTFTMPLLLLHGTQDAIVPVFASTMVYNGVSSGDKTWCKYPGAFHEIFQDEPAAATFFQDIVRWVDAHAAGEQPPTATEPEANNVDTTGGRGVEQV